MQKVISPGWIRSKPAISSRALLQEFWNDPVKLALRPDRNNKKIVLYDKQWELVDSVEENDETYCPAANMVGKDFAASWIALSTFLRYDEVRVVTTSVKDDHLRVLWGEIIRWVDTCLVPLRYEDGGPLIIRHRDIRKVRNGREDPISYLIGLVSEKGEGMAGHHAKHTLMIGDEACHDDQTEVLTDGGWKFFSELTGEEKLLSMDPLTRVAEYVKPTAIFAKKYSGPMYLYERRCGNFCVTPSHRMLWSRHRAECAIPWSEYYLEKLEDVNGTHRAIPRCFDWSGTPTEIFKLPELLGSRKNWPEKNLPVSEWVEFLGWVLSEGNIHIQNGTAYSVNLTQNHGPGLDRIMSLARILGFNPLVYETEKSPEVRINERRLAEYVMSHGRYCWEKRPPHFIGNLPPKLIDVFLNAYKCGDGYDKGSGREIIYTSSREMANELQILSYKAGRESTITTRELIGKPAPNGVSRRDGFVVARSRPGLDSHLKLKRKYLKKIDYQGEIFCANVPPHHTLFTRRNGVCMWSGNSGLDDVAYTQAATWAKRMLIFGNCNPCENFFRKGVEAGDLPRPF